MKTLMLQVFICLNKGVSSTPQSDVPQAGNGREGTSREGGSLPKASTGSSTHKWDWGVFPGKQQALLEEDKFDSMALKMLGSSGRGGDRHAVLRDGPDAGICTLGRAEGSS